MPEPISTSDEEGSESEEEAEVKVPPKKAGKKRAAEEAEEVEKPAKKAKASAAKEVGLLDLVFNNSFRQAHVLALPPIDRIRCHPFNTHQKGQEIKNRRRPNTYLQIPRHTCLHIHIHPHPHL